MDVDTDNFAEILDSFKEALSAATFVAVDLEMTGIKPEGAGNDDYWEPPELRYAKRREAAISFGIVQVGVCLFKEVLDDAGGESSFLVQPYNFFLFPRPINQPPDCIISPKILVDADAIHFVRCSHMDFGRWFGKGITYLDRHGEEALEGSLTQRCDDTCVAPEPWQSSVTAPSRELTQREETQRHQFMKRVVGNSANSPQTFDLSGKSYNLQQAIAQTMRDRHPNDNFVLEHRAGPLGGCREPACTLRNLGQDKAEFAKWAESEQAEAQRVLAEHVGFRHVWNALLQAGKPIVFHNGLLDLLFLFHWLEEPLPDTLAEFNEAWTSLLQSGVQFYDTKWIASYCNVGMDLCQNRGTALDALCRAVDCRGAGFNQKMYFPDNFNKYAENEGDQYHEAAFDAYCTGRIFAYFCRAGGSKFPSSALSKKTEGVVHTTEKSKQSSAIVGLKGKANMAWGNRFEDLLDSSQSSDDDAVLSDLVKDSLALIRSSNLPTSASALAVKAAPPKISFGNSKVSRGAGPIVLKGAPPKISFEMAANRIFLMWSAWDLLVAPSSCERLQHTPISFAYQSKQVAIRYIYDLQTLCTKKATQLLQDALKEHATRERADICPELDVRWLASGDVACAMLFPRSTKDDPLQNTLTLGLWLEAILDAVKFGSEKNTESPERTGKSADKSQNCQGEFQWCSDPSMLASSLKHSDM